MTRAEVPYSRVLVSGGAGFVGGHLVDALSDVTDVVVLDDLSTGRRRRVHPEATLVVGDVRDPEAVRDAVEAVDVVFHLAAQVSVAKSIEAPRESHRRNVTGTMNVLDAARAHDARVVLASSAAVYGQPDRVPISEEHPKRPTSPYGLEKYTAEEYARLYYDRFGLETISLRLFNVYGPGQAVDGNGGVVAIFLQQALSGDSITIRGDGRQTRDFVYVDDVVDAFVEAGMTDTIGQAVNVGTGDAIEIRELAECIATVVDTECEIERLPERSGDIRHSNADVDRARSVLSFEPTTTLQDGLDRTAKWYSNR